MPSEGWFIEKGPSIDSVGNKVTDFINNPPSSIAKGHPNVTTCPDNKRWKGISEGRNCTFCKRSDHNVTTCPDKENHVSSTMSKKI